MSAFAEVAWGALRSRYDELLRQLSSPALDVGKRKELQKEASRLGNLLELYDRLVAVESELSDVQAQRDATTDEGFRALCDEELLTLHEKYEEARAGLDLLLYPPDERDNRSAFLEIRAGTGGQEAALFASDLARMYMLYAAKKGWQASIVDESPTDLGGVREVILHIQGKNAYGHLKFESGVHRVQRVPKTEASGRIHTSTATVAVFPEAEDAELSINPADLRIDVYRAGGAGGQHVNKTESAVRITHIPTGIVVACQDERSQFKNKAKAMKVLQARLAAYQKEKTESEQSQKRREMVGTGERAEKVRTYNYPQNRVTDHQVGITLNKLDMVMEGALDEIVDALMQKEREERRQRRA
ncbi:MAG: peptide chain release factor 1 [Candidatus Dependentiae bacterium]|nr:peptide chain release factor 1 [Candidatus Dependentiae bacterium]